MYIKPLAALFTLCAAIPAWAEEEHCSPSSANHASQQPLQSSEPTLSLKHAISLAFNHDLRRRVALDNVASARTQNGVASLRPADRVSLQTENFPGIGRGGNIDSLDITGSYSRVWERGGKRYARENLAARGVDVAQAYASRTDREIEYEVRRLYASLLSNAAHRQVICLEIDHITEIKSIIDTRVGRSTDPALAGKRALTELLTAQFELEQLLIEETTQYTQLAQLTGFDGSFSIEIGAVNQLPTVRTVETNFTQLPDFKVLEAKQREAQARTALERAKQTPDITWNVGVRNFGLSDDIGVVTGVSIPLGTKARSNARIAQSSAKERVITSQQQALLQQLERRAGVLLQSSLQEVSLLTRLDQDLIPEATRALELAEDGYSRGALAFRDILDAHEVLIGLHKQRAHHLENYFMNDVELTRLSSSVAQMETAQ